jgi:hypothetical protein
MRRTAVTLLLTALVATAGLLVATPASACSCVGGTTQEFLDRADAVFTGRLLSREEPRDLFASSADPAVHLFAVDVVVKGEVREPQEVLSPVSGATCGLEIAGAGPFVVFATRSTELGYEQFTTLEDDQYAAFLCGGTAPLTPALEAELRSLAGPLPSPSATPLASPAPRAAETPTDGPSLLVPAVAGIGGLALTLVTALLVRRRRSAR